MLKHLILRTRFDDHFSRKAYHILVGTFVAFLFMYVFERKTAIAAILVATVILVIGDLVRLRFEGFNRFVLSVYGPLMRDEEENQPSAQLFFVLGLCWAFICLPRPIALQAILTLSWMDPVAGMIGVRYGKRTWNSVFSKLFVNFKSFPKSLGAKTIEGSLAGFAVAFLAGVIAWTGPWVGVPTASGLYWPGAGQVLPLAFAGATTAMIAEAWPSQWDDNANIPFWTGLVVWGVATLLDVPVNFW